MFNIIEYNEANFKLLEGDYEHLSQFLKGPNEETVQWIDIDISHKNCVESLGAYYKLHHLTVDDILNPGQLPKIEAFDDYFFLTLKMMHIADEDEIVYENVSFVAGKGFVITFQEKPGDVFEDVRSRIINYKGYLRKKKADYLFIRLVEAIADNYGITLEHIRQHIEGIESNLLNGKRHKVKISNEILFIKKDLNLIRGYIVPAREVLGKVKTETGHFLNKSTIAYLHDIQDHVGFQVSLFETLREMMKDLMDLYNAQTSNELNHIMKTLTIISALFIPLTFVAGWYGMNFEHMPEIDWPYSYPILIGLMIIMTLGMIIYMKTKKWF
jgi:magnesium transporter